MVDESPDRVVGAEVEVVEVVVDDLQRKFERGQDILMADVQASDNGFRVLAFASEAGLLVVEELAGDAVVVVHVKELALSLFDFLQHSSATVDLLLGSGGSFVQVVGDRSSDLLPLDVAERDGGVVLFDGRFHEVDGLVALGAFAALVAWADEVLVDAAVAPVTGVDEAAGAGAAADRALQVVLVLAVALPGVVVRSQDGLDLVE